MAYIAALVLIPVVFFYPYLARLFAYVMSKMSFLRRQESRPTGYGKLIRRLNIRTKPFRSRYGLFTRGVAVLMAYLFLISPPIVQNLAEAATQYSSLTTSQWAHAGTVITYQYDANGSMTQKVENDNGTETTTVYIYNLQNRLQRVETTISGNTDVVEYVYNDAGIRVQKIEDPEGTPIVTTYLVNENNHTGYAQVLEETIDDGLTSTPLKTTTYTLGDDVIAQAKTDWTWNVDHWEIATQYGTQTLLYDGHGSVRQHAASDGTLITYTHDPGGENHDYNNFNYDAYGHAITPLPEKDGLYYAGEMYDGDADQYYLRARYYDPSNGRFNRLDPYAGNNQDPQSLHKYLYCHANPVNGWDTSGQYVVMADISIASMLRTHLAACYMGALSGVMASVAYSMAGLSVNQALLAYLLDELLALVDIAVEIGAFLLDKLQQGVN